MGLQLDSILFVFHILSYLKLENVENAEIYVLRNLKRFHDAYFPVIYFSKLSKQFCVPSHSKPWKKKKKEEF